MAEIKHGVYKHYKGGEYRVHHNARLESTQEPVVFYEALYDTSGGKHFVRPAKEWEEMVEANGTRTPRFTFLHS